MSPLWKTRHRLRNRCRPSLFSAQHWCPHRCHPNLTQQHNTSPPLEDTGASLTTLTCQCHPLTTPTPTTPLQHHSQHWCPHRCHPNLTQQWHRCLAHHPSPVSAIYHHPNTLVRHSTSNTSHATTLQHQSQPDRNTSHAILYCVWNEKRGQYGNVLIILANLLLGWWIKKIVDPSNSSSLIRPNQCNGTQLYSSIRA